jgi:hypothetical protein
LPITGVVVSQQQLEQITDVDEAGFVEDEVLDTLRNGMPVRIYQFPCCSDSQGLKYLIGVSVHTYYRKHGVRCDKCDPNGFFVCDTCLGTTNNGVYDVVAIHNGPVEADPRHICLQCYSDNRKDLGAPAEDLPVNNHRVQGDPENPNLHQCETCGLKPDWRFSPRTSLKRTGLYEQLKKSLKDSSVKGSDGQRFKMVDEVKS